MIMPTEDKALEFKGKIFPSTKISISLFLLPLHHNYSTMAYESL